MLAAQVIIDARVECSRVSAAYSRAPVYMARIKSPEFSRRDHWKAVNTGRAVRELEISSLAPRAIPKQAVGPTFYPLTQRRPALFPYVLERAKRTAALRCIARAITLARLAKL